MQNPGLSDYPENVPDLLRIRADAAAETLIDFIAVNKALAVGEIFIYLPAAYPPTAPCLDINMFFFSCYHRYVLAFAIKSLLNNAYEADDGLFR